MPVPAIFETEVPLRVHSRGHHESVPVYSSFEFMGAQQPRDQFCVVSSPDAGFAAAVATNKMSSDEQGVTLRNDEIVSNNG